jgi:transcriptional regulator with GAF, ATPase, and Fis domain
VPATLEHLGVVGTSTAMSKVYATIDKISRYKANVLLLGESGSGKELIARALHARGPRRRHLFVPINCATLGRDLLENELFGHERGAFTGAHEKKRGLFELADGGTLFLDEIGELDPSTQAKLLRVLERNAFRRVGGTALVNVDLSVVAATNRNLEEAIAAKRFREDLYYRLKVVTIVVPPVRDRREDIPALVESFIADFNRRNGGKIRGIEPQAIRWLSELAWPGNVRELKNAVESAALLATSETIRLEEFESTTTSRRTAAVPSRASVPPSPALPADSIVVSAKATLTDVERVVISEHMRRATTKIAAARTLGIGLRTLYSKIRRYQIGAKA